MASVLVSLDINVIRDAIEKTRIGHGVASQLFILIRQGHIRAQVTNRLDVDVPDGPLRADIESLAELEVRRPGAGFRIGASRIGSPDFIVSEEQNEELGAMLNLLFPGAKPNSTKHRNRMADVDHLFAHRESGAIYFVTSDGAILRNAAQLLSRFGIQVIDPEGLLGKVA